MLKDATKVICKIMSLISQGTISYEKVKLFSRFEAPGHALLFHEHNLILVYQHGTLIFKSFHKFFGIQKENMINSELVSYVALTLAIFVSFEVEVFKSVQIIFLKMLACQTE